MAPREVLIAQADTTARRALAGMLQQLGYATLEAANPDAAMQLLETHDPEVVLLALDADPDAGLEALDRLRELAPEVPVIMLAADWRDARMADAMRRGAVAYLAPPFGPDDLREILARH